MPDKKLLRKVDLTHPKYLQTLVENRRIFNLENCELNVFESYQEAYRVPLTFNDFVITSMIRGKKIMHLYNKPSFEYLPGETVILPANETMVIDFPEATANTPTQCIALAVGYQYVSTTLDYLNNFYNSDSDHQHDWQLQFNQYHFDNDTEVTDIINKLMRICSGTDKGKSIFADLSLKELLIRLIQSQHLEQVHLETNTIHNQTRLHFVISYINEHLTESIAIDELCRKVYMSRNLFFKWFKEQFGLTPLEYITNERIKMSKQLLKKDKGSIATVGFECGFADVNYFVRIFKKTEGITPGVYRSCISE